MDAHLFDSFSRNLSLFFEMLVCQEAGGSTSRTMGGSRTVDGDEAVDGDVGDGDGDENCNRVSAKSRSVVRSLITGVCTCACKKNFGWVQVLLRRESVSCFNTLYFLFEGGLRAVGVEATCSSSDSSSDSSSLVGQEIKSGMVS